MPAVSARLMFGADEHTGEATVKASDITDNAFLHGMDEVVRLRSEINRPWTPGANRWIKTARISD